MTTLDEAVTLLDSLCLKLLEKKDWELNKNAEMVKKLLVSHQKRLTDFIETVEKLGQEETHESKQS